MSVSSSSSGPLLSGPHEGQVQLVSGTMLRGLGYAERELDQRLRVRAQPRLEVTEWRRFVRGQPELKATGGTAARRSAGLGLAVAVVRLAPHAYVRTPVGPAKASHGRGFSVKGRPEAAAQRPAPRRCSSSASAFSTGSGYCVQQNNTPAVGQPTAVTESASSGQPAPGEQDSAIRSRATVTRSLSICACPRTTATTSRLKARRSTFLAQSCTCRPAASSFSRYRPI
jgi:hypothetical protein